jgi:hypothetical protein
MISIDKRQHPNGANQLREGVLLMDLVRAVHAVRHATPPEFNLRWNDALLEHQGENGDKALLDFSGSDVIGLAYAVNSPRNPAINAGRDYFQALTSGIPASLNPALERLAISFKQTEARLPWVTAAIWSENGVLTTPGSLESFCEHAGAAVERLLIDYKAALRGYQRNLGLSATHAALIESIFERKRAKTGDWLLLTEEDFASLIAEGHAGLQLTNEIFIANRIHQPYRPNAG